MSEAKESYSVLQDSLQLTWIGVMALTFKYLAEYHGWAGNEIRLVVEELQHKEFTKKVMGESSVKSICEHIVLALTTCFLLADNSDDKGAYDAVKRASKPELLKKWRQLDHRLSSVVREIPQGTIEVPHISEAPFEIQVLDFYLQYLIHTTHHRGQLAMALRLLGKDVPGTDYLMYFRDKPGL
ncbi:MAG: DinB family protein [Candidatus Thorarchaeota archaeon]